MISSVIPLRQAQPTSPSPPSEQGPAQTQPQAAPMDTVQVSSSAKAALAEANETAAQTAQEANRGDLQAQRLVARRAEAKGTEKKGISELV